MNVFFRFATMLALTAVFTNTAKADFNTTLNLDRRSGDFTGTIFFSTTGASVPITYHRIESPNGIIYRTRGSLESSSFTNLSFSALMNECTNGLWTLTTNVGDPSEEQYGFSVDITGITSGMFGDTTITNPPTGTTVASSQPLIEWTSTSLLPEVHIQVHNGFQPPEPGNWVNMQAPVNSWTPPSPVLAGINYIFLSYQTNEYAGITISTPTNGVGTAIADWNADADVSSYDTSSFTAPGGSGDPFDVAVESPGLTWNTYGTDPWYISSLETSVGSSALQSGAQNYEFSTIEATVTGPGTVSFDWALFADYSDSFEFEMIDDSSGDDYDYFYYEGGDAYGWDSYSVTLSSNDTYTFTWTFNNDDDSANDLDAAFLDNVVYTYTGSGTGVSHAAEFEIDIERVVSGSSAYYVLFPRLSNVNPSSSLDEVESPNGFSSGTTNSSSSAQYATLQDAINEIQAGNWTIYFDRNGAAHEYTFTITVNSLDTNTIPPVVVIDPLDGATGVATNSDFEWIGPSGFDSLFVLARDVEGSSTLGFESLAPTATIWTNAPLFPTGTNSFQASYTSNNFGGLTISYPQSAGLNSMTSWNTSAEISSRANTQFIVGGGIIPLPVTILPSYTGGNLVMGFTSQSGTIHYVECTTNLVSGPWLPVTNFPGSGLLIQVNMPTTNSASFYRINTQ